MEFLSTEPLAIITKKQSIRAHFDKNDAHVNGVDGETRRRWKNFRNVRMKASSKLDKQDEWCNVIEKLRNFNGIF